jgi:DNA-binding MarR family transcriptional regulator
VKRAEDATVLADRLHSAAIHLLRRLRRVDEQSGVTAAQLSALSVLIGGRRTLGELAQAEQVSSPTMSRLVRELEALGLVKRTRDAGDGRVVWVEWTSHGRDVLHGAQVLRLDVLRQQIERLRPEEQLVLQTAVDMIDRMLPALYKEGR